MTLQEYADSVERFMCGACHVLAFALYQKLKPHGWKPFVIHTNGSHAAVVSPNKKWLLDVNGLQKLSEVLDLCEEDLDWGEEEVIFSFPKDEYELLDETDYFIERLEPDELDEEALTWAEMLASRVMGKKRLLSFSSADFISQPS